MIQADELYRFYRAGDEEVKALRGVSLEVDPGEIVVITGPSGSGKSTLLACLAGLDEPDGGAVWIDRTRISHRPEAERAALRARSIGVVFQSGNLIEHLTVGQNLDLVQRLAGRRDAAWADHVLELTGLIARTRARPSTLSGGEAARAGLAVALANRPAVLLADEPTGELDRATEAGILTLLRDQAQRPCAVVIASHSPAVRRFADRVLTLHDGRIT
ncbi:putative ABC transport system ATP-binding protein [Streptosporangium subroseum]|uniref:Putative ABC transport system ATP-binding protein n=1 Tax=Streptosporangium subroseum TaxID=106412 RepID=A0A239LT43_9ACTN|nr:ABC transporter ATP-binding protein [Streptosporangium subroseum]SNT33706.1 putative ABC transport system ATP-binding protein [Streptosporangium subroseum]